MLTRIVHNSERLCTFVDVRMQPVFLLLIRFSPVSSLVFARSITQKTEASVERQTWTPGARLLTPGV